MKKSNVFIWAAATAAAAALGTASVTAVPAAAVEPPPAPGGLTVPAQRVPDPNATVLNGAGESGYLSGWTRDGFNWTTYADGVTKPLPLPQGTTVAYGTGTDHVVFFGASLVVQRNMKDGSERTFALPKRQHVLAAFSDVVLTEETNYRGETTGLYLWEWRDGQFRDRPAGALVGATYVRVLDTDKDGVLYAVSPTEHLTFVYRLGRKSTSSVRLDHAAEETVLSGDRVTQWYAEGRVTVWDKADLDKPAHELRIAHGRDDRLLGTVGDHVLVARRLPGSTDVSYSSHNYRIVAVPLAGGTPAGGPERVLFERATAMPRFTPDGTMLIGRTDVDGGRAVYAVRPGADGSPAATKVVDAPLLNAVTERLALAQGRLTTMDRLPGDEPNLLRLRATDLTVGGELKAGARGERGTGKAVELLPTGDGRIAYAAPDGVRVVAEGAPLPGRTAVKLATQPGELKVSGRYAAVRTNGGIEVHDLDTGRLVYGSARGGASQFTLFGATLWRQKAAGFLESVDVRTGRILRSERVSQCDATDLRANATTLYWKCDGLGDEREEGAYDLGTRRGVPLPDSDRAELGDGYVAGRKRGVLSVTDVRGAGGTRQVGGVDRPWTVDAFGGHLAYVDAADAVQVVPSGVPASAPSAIDADTPDAVDVKSGSWTGRWWTSKPVAGWRLVLKGKGGEVVRTLSGGEARGLVTAVWDGRDASGGAVRSGTYTWTLTAPPADGAGGGLVSGGALRVGGAWRDHGSPGGGKPDGTADLLTLNAAGKAQFHHGDGRGALVAGAAGGGGWAKGTVLVPFADLNGDGCGDVLVRLPSGQLHAYHPVCGAALSTKSPSRLLGTAWAGFDVLTSPGDLTGDGRPDLLARQKTTGDVYRYSDNGKGGLTAPVKVGAAWKGHRAVIGAGDLNGDGIGDVLAVDKANSLWRYDGKAGGSLKAPVKVFAANWGVGRDVFVGVGDVTGDGRPDLVSRKTTGQLLRNNGNGKGSFGGTATVATGWQAYRGLF